MKIVNTLETIREGVALGTQTTLPPSYAATPHRIAGTPVVSPYGHHRHRHGQSLLNGLRSPPETATSRTSRVSIQSGHESDVISQIHVRLSHFFYSIINPPGPRVHIQVTHSQFRATILHLVLVLFVSQLPKYGIPYRLTFCSLKHSLHLDVI